MKNKLLFSFFKSKYGFDDKKINELIENSKNDGTISEWYKIAMLKMQEEMDKNV